MRDPIVDKIALHVARVAAGDLPDAARDAAKIFIADSLGVGIAGAAAPWRREVLDMAAASGGHPEATVWGSGERLPLAGAVMVNGYQMHALEFDCVHEGAVVHAMSAILPALLGWAEREGNVPGEKLIRAVIAGVDVGVTLGLCSRAPMRFFRPANCSGFGAVAGLALLAGISEMQLRDALGIYYGECAGTMQAHIEASPQLAMQMGFAARSAVTAVELARRGMPGPRAPISGQFGYFALFDGEADPAPFDALGRVWRICELSHKPWPTGRATHGGIDGLQRLIAAHGIGADEVRAGRFLVPPLTYRLVGRPPQEEMTVAYARLCLSYVGAVCLRRGMVVTDDFTLEALGDADTLASARRLSVIADSNPDPNALHPIRVELDLADGRSLTCDVSEVLGSPSRPLSPDAARAKFASCGASAALWDAALTLDRILDVGVLARF
ncbi:MAG TPA: MmgE/PrpD family protein [Stellaceae bacterium]|jgi:2-methylcitrate dehydratase PrpD|nr:MmgE/PrpD family protein [Stellaceae bacterium]